MIAWGLYMPAQAALAQVLLERAWTRGRHGEIGAKPWPWADIMPLPEIEVPPLPARAVVLEGSNGSARAVRPGHMPNSAAIGAPGTAVIAAHRDTQFRRLGELKLGDEIIATTRDGRRVSFRVVSTHIMEANASGLDPADPGPTGSRLALVTCYPFDGVLHSPLRYAVLANRQNTPAGDESTGMSNAIIPAPHSKFWG